MCSAFWILVTIVMLDIGPSELLNEILHVILNNETFPMLPKIKICTIMHEIKSCSVILPNLTSSSLTSRHKHYS